MTQKNCTNQSPIRQGHSVLGSFSGQCPDLNGVSPTAQRKTGSGGVLQWAPFVPRLDLVKWSHMAPIG